MLCSRCNKRVAVIYISKIENGKPVREGLCLQCAKELGFNPAKDLMKGFPGTEEEMQQMNEQLSEMLAELSNSEDFSEGGAPSLDFMENFLGGSGTPAMNSGEPAKDKKKDKKQKQDKSDKQELKFLSQYCQNLTEKARNGKLDNIIGRDKEIERVLQILNRRTKNNPCLIGEPGVGKTAIAEGIAIKIAKKEVPAKIACKEIYLLDFTALIAGTQFRGQFESRIKGLIEEVKRVGNVILVIDEVHNLVGSGDAEGSMNAANMLKPALSRGEIQVIGATTLKEYRKHIEKDAALERRFQPVMVNEPSVSESIEMIKGIKKYYEHYHNIKIPMILAEKAVEMSERYVTDRFLPDKAIDLIDEACSKAVLKNPIYEDSFKKEQIRKQINTEIEALESKETPEESDYAALAEKRSELYRIEAELAELQKQIDEVSVTMDDVASVIELWTGIPASKIRAGENEKLRSLESSIKEKIVGQDKAVKAVASAVKRGRISLVPRKRPISFIFTGPTGVGKTELVKVLSKELFDSPETLVRLDMSEFMEKHSVSRIIGSPPGYVGYDEAGQLTEKIRRKPYSVVLFDEIEKAHPDVLNVLLQVLDDGRITDAQGRTVSFEHTIIVMTSNAGSNIKGGSAGFNKTSSELNEEKVKKALGEFLRPEFINRVDEIITFDPLPREIFPDIVKISLKELKEGLAERDVALEYSPEVLEVLADKSYSAEFGARNIRRVVQKDIEDKVVEEMCMTDIIPQKITIEVSDGEIIIDVK
ncbi:MAG: AAA family ATPase [Clostridia bacterium]|nr:AAA family ATPase [Clostridia bacterium]